MFNMIGTLKTYIESELLDNQLSLMPDDDLLSVGMLSSLQFMRMIQHIESTQSISIPPKDMVLENFQTMTNIATYLKLEHDLQ